jgi:hypothetical protein
VETPQSQLNKAINRSFVEVGNRWSMQGPDPLWGNLVLDDDVATVAQEGTA